MMAVEKANLQNRILTGFATPILGHPLEFDDLWKRFSKVK